MLTKSKHLILTLLFMVLAGCVNDKALNKSNDPIINNNGKAGLTATGMTVDVPGPLLRSEIILDEMPELDKWTKVTIKVKLNRDAKTYYTEPHTEDFPEGPEIILTGSEGVELNTVSKDRINNGIKGQEYRASFKIRPFMVGGLEINSNGASIKFTLDDNGKTVFMKSREEWEVMIGPKHAAVKNMGEGIDTMTIYRYTPEQNEMINKLWPPKYLAPKNKPIIIVTPERIQLGEIEIVPAPAIGHVSKVIWTLKAKDRGELPKVEQLMSFKSVVHAKPGQEYVTKDQIEEYRDAFKCSDISAWEIMNDSTYALSFTIEPLMIIKNSENGRLRISWWYGMPPENKYGRYKSIYFVIGEDGKLKTIDGHEMKETEK
ncbi:hypothetical protein HZA73_09440 [candidate division TA06 bacterium]|nr:hypothetical protein [candidate division TA06 bacterium]